LNTWPATAYGQKVRGKKKEFVDRYDSSMIWLRALPLACACSRNGPWYHEQA
jgi:hypothetical protein